MVSRMRWVRGCAVVMAMSVVAAPGMAQEGARSPERAAQTAQDAAQAEAAGDYARAMRLYERAYWEHNDALYIYRRIVLYERMGRADAGLALLEGNREELSRSEAITDLALLEQRLRDGAKASQAERGEQSDVLGWALVGGGGALMIAGGVALWAVGGVRDEVLCASNVSGGQGCDGDARGPITAAELEDARSREGLYSGLGVGGVALGAALAGFGIYWLVSRDDSQQDSTTSLKLWAVPDRGGATAGVEWSY
jgi:hypothetical protein